MTKLTVIFPYQQAKLESLTCNHNAINAGSAMLTSDPHIFRIFESELSITLSDKQVIMPQHH